MGFQSGNVEGSLGFGIADGAAAPSTAVALIPNGVPDATDVADVVMPAAGIAIGISLQSPVSSGDTVNLQLTINGTANAGLSVTNSNAAPNQTQWNGTGVAFASGQRLGLKYLTTTGGTYTVHDILGQLYFAFVEPVGGVNA